MEMPVVIRTESPTSGALAFPIVCNFVFIICICYVFWLFSVAYDLMQLEHLIYSNSFVHKIDWQTCCRRKLNRQILIERKVFC